MRCRLCDSNRLLSVLDLGATPPCETFLTADELDSPEATFPLHLRVCEDCLLLQIPALITPEDTFTEYAYFSSFSDSWVQHAKTFVDDAAERLGLGRRFVRRRSREQRRLSPTACGRRGIPCLGIEPSVKSGPPPVSVGADQNGLPRRGRGRISARQARSRGLVVANNVYAHIPDLLGFTRSLRTLLADDGWLSIEVHHALNLVTLGQFDTIYHEHFQYYTVLSAMRALATAGLAVVDVEMIPTHGGSIRLWARPKHAPVPPSDRVGEVLRIEKEAGLHQVEGYLQLRPRTEEVRHELLRFLLDCRAEGKRVVGYGAPGKGNTLLNYCGIRSDLLEYTVNRNPYKHGRFTPGTRIPIHDPAQIDKDRPDVVLALPWNLEAELTEQLGYIAEWGGQARLSPAQAARRSRYSNFDDNGRSAT